MPWPCGSVRRARPLLGTIVEIVAEPSPDAAVAVDGAFRAIELVQRLMSFHDPASDVSRINAAAPGAEIGVDALTFEVLRAALNLADVSEGCFDIAMAAPLVANGFLPAPPGCDHGEDGAPGAIELLEGQRVRWHRKGLIDLGGIAKGFAVDRAVSVLQSRGVARGVVNAGGDLRCFGRAQAIHVRHPDAPTQFVGLGQLRDAALATSSGYFAGIRVGARQIDPLVDPRLNACVTWEKSVSVAAPTCMLADALTKVVRLSPRAPEILLGLDAQAIVIAGKRMATCGVDHLQGEFAA